MRPPTESEKMLVGRIMTTFGIIEIRIDLLADSDLKHAHQVLAAIFNPPEAEVEILEILKTFVEALKDFSDKRYPEQVPVPRASQPGDRKLDSPRKPEGGA